MPPAAPQKPAAPYPSPPQTRSEVHPSDGELMLNSESNAALSSASSDYALDNAAREASARFAALAAMYDPGTIRHLEQRGVTSGWHCLEVGGGGGSIAGQLGAP